MLNRPAVRRLLPIGLVVGLLASTGQAAATLCIGRYRTTGPVRLRRGPCRKRERELTACLRLFNGARRQVGISETACAQPPDCFGGLFLNTTVKSPVDGRLLAVPFTQTGVYEYVGLHAFFTLCHAAPGCADAGLALADPTDPIRRTTAWAGKVYYAGDPVTAQPYASCTIAMPDCTAPDHLCCVGQTGSTVAGPAVSFEESAFGAGPFRVKRCRVRRGG